MAELPTGTVTFLITDLEGSTRLWEQQPDSTMHEALARHDAIFQDVVTRNGGAVYNNMGDGVLAVFGSAVLLARPSQLLTSLRALSRSSVRRVATPMPFS